MPHPAYAAHGGVCILNPSAKSRELIEGLVSAAYEGAVAKRARWFRLRRRRSAARGYVAVEGATASRRQGVNRAHPAEAANR
jgi:hypothetical protein